MYVVKLQTAMMCTCMLAASEVTYYLLVGIVCKYELECYINILVYSTEGTIIS